MGRSHVALLSVLLAPVVLYAGVMLPRSIPSRTDEPTSPAAFFPTAVGTKWVYQTTRYHLRRVDSGEETDLIIDARDDGDDRIVSIHRFGDLVPDASLQKRQLKISSDGVRSRDFAPRPTWRWEADGEPTPWRVMFPADLSVGAQWAVDHEDERTRHVYTVNGWETVHVPAGAYRAARVDFTIIDRDSSGKEVGKLAWVVWCSPGVGVIKLELATTFVPFKIVIALKSFDTPAR